ncbi:tyrosine-type recombinase/integrase [Brucella pituitosa]|uniref:Tyrosine-type recombinase/integrase n=1 Tax=Brucella pituitosa TaxID=571256 RepID=A0ABS3JU42_9HYPH|nr:tyrosine-type recombinase/integrase [Brucella pituitosa]MBO1038182.1 tyrosine-type recombinase/integrase [Brucella pituitosa]
MKKRSNGLPKNCTIAFDRHGKRRIRFRRKGFDTYLPYPPVGEEFDRAYTSALAGVKEWGENIGSSRTKPGTMNALAVAYYRSPEFKGQRETTQKVYRAIVERFRKQHGHRLIKDLRREHIKTLIGKMSETPAAANRLLSLLRIMLNVALDNGWISANPAIGIKGYSKKTDGHHSWTDEEVAAYEARHPKGTKARLALDLLLYTAQRRGDVVRMGWQHVNVDKISVRQEKTGKKLDLPILPELWEAIGSLPRENPTFFTGTNGKPYISASFGNWFRKRCDEAGLSHCSAHGLRKAAARRMAEAGLSGDVIKSVTGHTNLSMLTIYTNAANQAVLAEAGMKAISSAKTKGTLSNHPEKVGQEGS